MGCHKAEVTHIEAASVAYLLGVEQRGFNVAFALGLEHIHAESAMPVELLHQLEWRELLALKTKRLKVAPIILSRTVAASFGSRGTPGYARLRQA